MLEIERKYMVINDDFLAMATASKRICQGYLSTNPLSTIRVRTMDIKPLNGSDTPAEAKAYITVKSKSKGCVRDEWEYEIPIDDALQMMSLCECKLEKTRYIAPYEGYVWEVDIFEGALKGINIAEIELPDADAKYAVPSFAGEEVTGNPMYFNSNLARCASTRSQR